MLRARTVDINVIDIVFHEQFTQTIFDKSSVVVDDLVIKSVTKTNQTTLQLITEQFSADYLPSSIRLYTILTDNLGNDNQWSDTPADNITDGVAPSPILMIPGLPLFPNFESHYLTIEFDELLGSTKPPIDSITLYNTSSALPHNYQPDLITYYGQSHDIWLVESHSPGQPFIPTLFMNVTGPIPDRSGNNVQLGTILYDYDGQIPTLTDARVKDSNTITMTFDKVINYSTVSIQDFTVNATITISDVLTRGDTIYLTTDSLLPGESYNVSLVGSVADYFNNATNTTSVVILYETVVAENFTITSNNANPTYAKSGDTLTINLTIDEILTSASATILGNNVQHTSTGKTITINTVVPVNVVDGFATFAIYVETVDGSIRTFTQNDLTDNSNVLIDNTNPSFVSSSYDINKLVHLTFSENISSASAYEHDNNNEILTTINGPVVTLNTTSIQNTSTLINATVYDYAGNSYSHLPVNISSLISPITISSLNIANNGTSIARANQSITVTLVTDGTDLGNFTGTLLGRSFTNTTSGGNATFTTTVFANDSTNENATFSITATNSSGSRIHITNDDITDGSFVTIDTVKPVIILNGNSDDTVLQGNNYVDLGATVSDPNNSLYNEIVTATTNLNTSLLGAQNITYFAPADAAGNVPDSINRTVTVQAKPLGLETLTIQSNNLENIAYAKTGDRVEMTLVTNGTIGSATVTIASNPINPLLIGFNGKNLALNHNLDSSIADTNSLEFIITVTNEDNTTTSTFTEANLPGSSIIIDNTAPTIVLVGNNNTVVPTNSSYTDLGATASDLSYAADIPVTGTSNIDTTQSGNYTFTYTAPDDEAGNPGPIITRNVIVADTPPIGITTLTIATASGTLYAKAGDTVYLTLEVNNTISTHNIQILNASVTSISPNDNALRLQAQVSDNATESNAEFTITITNPNGTTLTVTEDDLTSSNVFIDTISPRIQLIGSSANYSIINGTDPIILNVTVTDGDANVAST